MKLLRFDQFLNEGNVFQKLGYTKGDDESIGEKIYNYLLKNIETITVDRVVCQGGVEYNFVIKKYNSDDDPFDEEIDLKRDIKVSLSNVGWTPITGNIYSIFLNEIRLEISKKLTFKIFKIVRDEYFKKREEKKLLQKKEKNDEIKNKKMEIEDFFSKM
jgi:hypothetical protein